MKFFYWKTSVPDVRVGQMRVTVSIKIFAPKYAEVRPKKMILFDPLIENPSLLCLPFAYKNFESLNCGFWIFYKCVWTSSGHVFCWRHRWVIKIFPIDPISGSHFSVLEVSRKNGKSPNHFKIILRDSSSKKKNKKKTETFVTW